MLCQVDPPQDVGVGRPGHESDVDGEDLAVDDAESTAFVLDDVDQLAAAGNRIHASTPDASEELMLVTEQVSLVPDVYVDVDQTYFDPWDGGHRGSRENLDNLARNDSRQRVTDALIECVAAEGPIHRERLAKAVAASFGLTKVNADRQRSILHLAPSGLQCHDEPDFYWAGSGDLSAWKVFRQSDTYERRVEHIALREIANSMHALCVLSGGMDEAELLRESLATFGGQRLTAGIEKRMKGALQFAVREELLIHEDGMVFSATS